MGASSKLPRLAAEWHIAATEIADAEDRDRAGKAAAALALKETRLEGSGLQEMVVLDSP